MIICAGGAEERHTSAGVGVGIWSSINGMTISTGGQTGGYSYKWHTGAGSTQGGGPFQTNVSNAWWSFAGLTPQFTNGTWQAFFDLGYHGSPSKIRVLLWEIASSGPPVTYKLSLADSVTPTVLASSTDTFTRQWVFVKLEYAEGVWTCWGDFGAGWKEQFSYDDTGIDTVLDQVRMDVVSGSDEGKTFAFPAQADDCVLWDDAGDNWNSRITAMGEWPRISAAHLPETSDNSTSGIEYQDLDELVPDHSQSSGETKSGYLAVVEDLDDGTKGWEDYTAETIQAVMVTHVAGTAAVDADRKIYNVKTGGTEYLDSEEDGRFIQWGDDAGGANAWSTAAGCYPHTPAATPSDWTEALFNAAEYGFKLIDGKSDQMTVQIIYFGSAHEWPVPSAGFPHSQAVII